MASGHHVLFSGNERQRNYISATFPGIDTVHLDGYDVWYTRSRSTFMFAIAAQIPKLHKAIKAEHDWLSELAKERHIDVVISDNRYGLYHPFISSAIMTHQLQVLTGFGKAADTLARKLHYKYLDKFSQCWVVDIPGVPGLAGELSHPGEIPGNTTYLGLLSQMEKEQQQGDYLLVLLSGPEPQRSILSDQLWQQVLQHKGKVVFVEGSDKVTPKNNIPGHITYHKLIAKTQLQPVLAGANMVICRSGYSTIMDLVKLNKKAILIPTPGQTEQEYLARNLQASGAFMYAEQGQFNLSDLLASSAGFSFYNPVTPGAFELYKSVVNGLIE